MERPAAVQAVVGAFQLHGFSLLLVLSTDFWWLPALPGFFFRACRKLFVFTRIAGGLFSLKLQ